MTATDPSSPARRPLLHGWRGLGVIAVLVLLGVLVALACWLAGDGDLRRIERDLAAAGVARTWAELGVKAADPATKAVYERLNTLANRLKPWEPGYGNQLQPGLPLPPALAAWHAKLPSAELAEALKLIDGLDGKRPYLRGGYSYNDQIPETAWKLLVRLIGQRLALADEADVPIEASRLLRLLRCAPRLPFSLGRLFDARLLEIAASHLAVRLPILRGRGEVADDLEMLAQRLEAERESSGQGEFLALVPFLHDVELPLAMRLRYRLSREGLLRHQLAWLLRSRSCALGMQRHELTQRMGEERKKNPLSLLDSHYHVGLSFVQFEHSPVRAHIFATVVAAEIRAGPWPVDPYSTSGAPLRRLERDGRLIGAYSIGRNGVDDHGKSSSKDDGIALYGPWDEPVAPLIPAAK